MPLTPVAVSEAKVAASNMIKGATHAPDYAGIPTAVFAIPELARVGRLESEAREAGIDLVVRYSNTSDSYSNYRIGETTAAAKILVDQSNDQIVGAHLLGPEYGELINTLGLAIKLGLTIRQLTSARAAYPRWDPTWAQCSRSLASPAGRTHGSSAAPPQTRLICRRTRLASPATGTPE